MTRVADLCCDREEYSIFEGSCTDCERGYRAPCATSALTAVEEVFLGTKRVPIYI